MATLAKSGPQSEVLTIKETGEQVRANVNRRGNQFNADSGVNQAAKVPTGAIVLVPHPQYTTAPEVGQTFVDSRGKHHLIQTVTFVGGGWECVCGIS